MYIDIYVHVITHLMYLIIYVLLLFQFGYITYNILDMANIIRCILVTCYVYFTSESHKFTDYCCSEDKMWQKRRKYLSRHERSWSEEWRCSVNLPRRRHRGRHPLELLLNIWPRSTPLRTRIYPWRSSSISWPSHILNVHVYILNVQLL